MKTIRMISTRHDAPTCTFAEAMTRGLAPDGGLYIPESIPRLPQVFWERLPELSLRQIGREITEPFFESDEDKALAGEVVDHALSFDTPLVHLRDNIYILELFHGPTLAFKDFGARFMARAFAAFGNRQNDKDLLILVATSGDTGSAVAHGFHGVEGTKVCLLYPSGKVSVLQEQQMTTLGGNVTALEVDGTFDDCQALVKQAFSDSDLGQVLRMSSANSINIARLLPQSFYYVHALAQLMKRTGQPARPLFSVPSGNFGNLTAGLIAGKMGMPFSRFLAATNRNDVVPRFLESGQFEPRPSEQTISNAMDVGNPSNFERILHLFDGLPEKVQACIWGASFTDSQTRECIRNVHRQHGYVADPHTAVGLLAAEKYLDSPGAVTDQPVVVLSTAHPAKFGEVVEDQVGQVKVPKRLQACMVMEKKSLQVGSDYSAFRDFLIKTFS